MLSQLKLACSALLILCLSGCGLRLLNVVTPGGSVERIADLAYGDDPRQQLDLYRPEAGGAHAPVILFIHGGYWSSGERQDYRFVGETLAKAGYLTAVMSYRLYPDVVFPAFIEDAASAVAWLKQHAVEFGGDAEELFLVGHSSGAHSAVMLALDPSYLRAVGGEPRRWLSGVVGLSGPYDFLPPRNARVAKIFPTEQSHHAGNPVNFADAKAPPLLLIHGRDDDTVWPINSQNLAQKLREAGQDVSLELIDGGHAQPLIAFSGPWRGNSDVLRTVDRFMADHEHRLAGNPGLSLTP